MTNEQAIRHLEDLQRLYLGNEKFTADIEAIEIAIEVLKKRPCEDCISRQAIINKIANTCFWLSADNWEELIKCINSISPVTPKFTDTEIQKMQELEQAQLDKAYELGKAEIQPCEDCVSRETVHEMLENIPVNESDKWFNWLQRACLRLAELPPVQPTRPTGWWFIDERPESDREVVCSNCDQPIFKYHKLDFDYRPKYCPNCGAKMTEGEEV